MLYRKPKIRIMGDRAVLVELGEGIHPKINQKVRALYTGLASSQFFICTEKTDW